MSYRKPMIGLVLFLVLSLMATWMVYVTLSRGISGKTNTYSAMFTDVTGLKVGDDVRVAGVRVGRVDDIELDDALAKVSFRVDRSQALYTDTVASVTYQNAVGQRYLGLTPGQDDSHEKLAHHGQIPLEHTEPSFDLTHLLRGFEPLLSLLDPEQVDNLTTAILQSLQGDDGTVLNLINQTSALAELLAGPDQVLGDLIGNLNAVVTDLAAQNTNLDTVIDQSRSLVAGLAHRRDELRTAVGSINETVRRLSMIVDNVYPDLNELTTREPGFAAYLVGDGRDRISYFGSNLPQLLKGFARVSQSGAYLELYACDLNSSLFAFLSRLIPGIVRAATPGNVIKHSPVCR
ncbi:MCE family protein [[Mycobacterium] nativiensis]|uniref:MCE family protein n=1 Tax=[Mycobacterium] nativiensis TaxID=2855503 RepID=A0ABU5XVJ4_9MYCO|nr:MCE family protein [Mycolicibacter sp. MYC340]MEB3031822.1 MCE family protein [Mycolicibacter sp. MYC340]